MIALGIIIGLLLAILVLLFLMKYGNNVERTIHQTKAKLGEKGAVFTPTDETEDFDKFINQLPQE